jgi:hypothetical protein
MLKEAQVRASTARQNTVADAKQSANASSVKIYSESNPAAVTAASVKEAKQRE